MLQRVQLLLDQKTKRELEYIALHARRSFSAIVREMLDKQLRHERGQKKEKGGISFLRSLADKAVVGPGDSEYDAYAYGTR